MAIQNDNTLVTKGDLKSLYTDKIAPYLGGGISYYYTDRTGEELKSIDMRLSASQTVNAGSTQNTLINFDKSSGTYETNNHKVIIPAGQRIQINVALQASPGASNAVDGEWQIYDYTNDIIISKANFTYIGSGYSWSSIKSVQYTAPENGALVGVKVTALFYNTSVTTSSSFTIQEIGRIVDPIKYMDNNSDLEETPVGNIISYMGNSVPKHHLACDGTEYAIGTYPELEAHIIKEFGSINYFGGDGTTTWAVPDLNGEFLRGTGTNSHTNQGSGANVGEHQDGTLIFGGGVASENNSFYVSKGTPTQAITLIGGDGTQELSTKMRIITSTSEANYKTKRGYTRPTNTSVKFCIKYESTYHVIVPSHMYKVSIAGSISTGSGDAQYTFDSSDIIGDASLVSGNSFVAPVDGFYVIGMDVTNKGSTSTYTFIKVNGVDREFVTSSGSTHSLYLNKGDVITIWQHGNTASHTNSGRLSFCLLTANYKDNIIAGGEVYSEEEQVIGTWTDGKPLYQKTFITTSPSAIDTSKNISIGASVDKGFIKYGSVDDGLGNLLPLPFSTNAGFTTPIRAIIVNNSSSSNKNTIQLYTKATAWLNKTTYLTIQYTKTTDQANTYQYKNSLLLTRPDMWEPNTEYDFGGGLYGKRIMDTSIDIASGNTIQPSIAASGVTAIVGYGGMYGNSSSAMAGFGAPIVIRTNSTIAAESAPQINGTGGLVARICNINWTTNINKYDVWVTYRKA